MTTTTTSITTDIADALNAGKQLGATLAEPYVYGREHDDAFAVYVVPEGYTAQAVQLANDSLRAAPRRTQRAVTVTDVPSFLAYIARHAEPGRLEVFADAKRSTMEAILDAPQKGAPSWATHSVTLTLDHTPEWDRWVGNNSRYIPQATFAELIEEGLPEIVEPAGVDLLTLVQHVEGSIGGRFVSRARLEDGSTHLVVENDVQVTGKDGKTAIVLPKDLRLAVRPWTASTAAEELRARFRIRVDGSKGVHFGYLIDRLAEVLDHGFGLLVADVEAGLSEVGQGVKLFRGTAPACVTLPAI